MCLPMASVSLGLAVPLKSLKRLSSLRLRAFLRSGAGVVCVPGLAGFLRRGLFLRASLRRVPLAFGGQVPASML